MLLAHEGRSDGTKTYTLFTERSSEVKHIIERLEATLDSNNRSSSTYVALGLLRTLLRDGQVKPSVYYAENQQRVSSQAWVAGTLEMVKLLGLN